MNKAKPKTIKAWAVIGSDDTNNDFSFQQLHYTKKDAKKSWVLKFASLFKVVPITITLDDKAKRR